MSEFSKKPEGFLIKYQLPLFFVLTYLLSWWSAPLMNGQIIPYGPSLAALVVIAMTTGKIGLSQWWRRLTNWRVNWYWYVVGPAIIISYQGLAYIINLLSGAVVIQPPSLPSMGIVLELLLIGGMWEEPGWSGYALPELQKRFAKQRNGLLISALILGVFRALWHMPLYLSGNVYWFDLLFFEIAIQLIIAWLYNRSGGSVPVVMLFHLTSNILGSVMYPVFTGAERTTYYVIFMGLATLFAIALGVIQFASSVNPRRSLPAQQ